MMLALIKKSDLSIAEVVAHGRTATLPGGGEVSPAQRGWENDQFLLREIAKAEALPAGKISKGQVAKMIDGNPQFVHDLVDKPRRARGTFREFMDLFTVNEQLAIATAAQQNPQIKLWYDRAMAGDIELTDETTVQGIQVLLKAGLISPGAEAAIASADLDDGPTIRTD